ncbi:cytochrome-c oxidase, cbb3-type subunit III [Candidatus Venteria ishoeyi]|uniref:cytochrome-c oxidase, cbb3-type subunit III n=1 Tax=Candidatus Venteria ishoeyi TaxID=1899563 RepID=UPI0025A4E74F|nr:cytochrome-c oxidase, cbb3-type subunit III [Candidatus Venteria ishoeyi]MDM8545118.1 cytochrome-c oxidase, cbb3-type subunit III [Candidatus Venteria ishoeyi]
MFDFVSPFWSWFIIAGTGGGIIAMFILNIWLGKDSGPKGENGETVTMGHVWDEDLAEYNNPLPKWWLNMFYITLVFGIVYLILYPGMGSFQGVLGWTQANQYDTEVKAADAQYGPLYEKHLKVPVAALVKDADALKMGERLYLNYCTVCHGSDAGGGPGYPNLRDEDWLWGGTPEQIKAGITNGRMGMMPPKGGKTDMTEADVQDVAAYVFSLSGRDAKAGDAAKGKTTFDTVCMACHLPDGKGNQALGGANLTDNIWLYGGSEKAVHKTITEGRSGKMPAHGEFLGEAKVHLLTAYIYSLSNK